MHVHLKFELNNYESTSAVARGNVVLNGEHVGLVSMPRSMWDYFVETVWDGNATLVEDGIIFAKNQFSDMSVKQPINKG